MAVHGASDAGGRKAEREEGTHDVSKVRSVFLCGLGIFRLYRPVRRRREGDVLR
jgi:hypothetical protein